MITLRDEIINEYFEWLCEVVCKRKGIKRASYKKLLVYLHDTEFIYTIPDDRNRAEDGADLRHRFVMTVGYMNMYKQAMDILDGPCSILEMMVALAIHCEENIMDDPNMGDRTGQWFWNMVISLGLGPFVDAKFDRRLVDDIINRFLDREYEPDGRGGLFTIRHCTRDLRTVAIWHQLCWYLNGIT